MRESRYALLTRGSQVGTGTVGGHEAPYELCGTTVSSTMSSYTRRLGPFLGELAPDGVVLDKWNVLDPLFTRLVISGPLVDVGLQDDEIDRCPEVPSYLLGPGGLSGGFETLAKVKQANPRWTGLDKISRKAYVELWRAAGARVGYRAGDYIQWEDGAVEPIPPVDDYQVWTSCDECVR